MLRACVLLPPRQNWWKAFKNEKAVKIWPGAPAAGSLFPSSSVIFADICDFQHSEMSPKLSLFAHCDRRSTGKRSKMLDFWSVHCATQLRMNWAEFHMESENFKVVNLRCPFMKYHLVVLIDVSFDAKIEFSDDFCCPHGLTSWTDIQFRAFVRKKQFKDKAVRSAGTRSCVAQWTDHGQMRILCCFCTFVA